MHSKILHGIDTVIVRVADYSFSKKWYEEKLELTPVWDDPILKLAVMDTGSPTSITLWQTDSKIEVNRKTASYPIFRILSAVEAHSALQKRGVQVSSSPIMQLPTSLSLTPMAMCLKRARFMRNF